MRLMRLLLSEALPDLFGGTFAEHLVELVGFFVVGFYFVPGFELHFGAVLLGSGPFGVCGVHAVGFLGAFANFFAQVGSAFGFTAGCQQAGREQEQG